MNDDITKQKNNFKKTVLYEFFSGGLCFFFGPMAGKGEGGQVERVL
jgi:hypothetical protein